MLTLIDANVILRYLLDDNEEMAERSKSVIEAGAQSTPDVLAEVVYVLKGVYKIPRKAVSETLQVFVEEIYVEESAEVHLALELYGSTNLDFVDCLLIARHRITGVPVFSFDQKLNRRLAE